MDFKQVMSYKAITVVSGAVLVFHAFIVITTFNHHLYLSLVPESKLLTVTYVVHFEIFFLSQVFIGFTDSPGWENSEKSDATFWPRKINWKS